MSFGDGNDNEVGDEKRKGKDVNYFNYAEFDRRRHWRQKRLLPEGRKKRPKGTTLLPFVDINIDRWLIT